MTFADAAADLLARNRDSGPMHYRDICDIAVAEGLIQPGGLTPHASINASMTSEIRRQIGAGDLPRFVSHGRGYFSLMVGSVDPEVETAIRDHNDRIQGRLAAELWEMDPRVFEQLIGRLLEAVGFDEVVVTRYSADGGIDVRGKLSVGVGDAASEYALAYRALFVSPEGPVRRKP